MDPGVGQEALAGDDSPAWRRHSLDSALRDGKKKMLLRRRVGTVRTVS